VVKEDGAVLLEVPPDVPFLESEELRDLVAEGRERGSLTFEKIAACLEEVEVTKEQVQALHAHLVENGVEVLAADGVRPSAQPADGQPASSDAQPVQARKPAIDLTVEPSLDSLRLYLRSVASPCSARRRRCRCPSGSSAATWRPRRTWSRPICGLWCRSPRAIWAAACRFST
jgi:hypothetical protein